MFFCCTDCVCASSKCIEPFEAMATSDAMWRWPRRFHRAAPCLLLCAASLGLFDVLHRLSFVQGVVWYGTRAAQRQVAQRFSRQRKPTRGELDADGKADARRLTSSIKKAYSAEKLIGSGWPDLQLFPCISCLHPAGKVETGKGPATKGLG